MQLIYGIRSKKGTGLILVRLSPSTMYLLYSTVYYLYPPCCRVNVLPFSHRFGFGLLFHRRQGWWLV